LFGVKVDYQVNGFKKNGILGIVLLHILWHFQGQIQDFL
jgi:hypothetical protein